jgi:tRNA(Ile)-lysidine synthase
VSKKTIYPLEAIREVFQRLQICDQSLLIAVSGGADSVGLLVLLNELKNELNLELHVGHFDHQLRSGSRADAEWVQSLCKEMSINCVVGTPSEDNKLKPAGVEESARRNRYHFLKSLAEELNCPWIAVAHTENDQVETVLHHIARGTGLKGLQGIPETRDLSPEVSLLRPLLKIRREQLIDVLSTLQQTFRIDQTNTDSAYTRNRIRHEVIPYLRTSLNPQIDQALINLSNQAQEAQNAIEQIADHVLSKALDGGIEGQIVRLNTEQFVTQPRAVIIAAMMILWEQQRWPRQRMSQHHWTQLADITLNNKSATGLSCPGGIQVILRRKVMEFQRKTELQKLDRSSGSPN